MYIALCLLQLVGSEQNNAAVYVDPYLVEQGKDNDVTLTEPFELLSGAVDGIPMVRNLNSFIAKYTSVI